MRARRGVTFVEVALAVALLAGLAGVIATAYDGIGKMTTHEQDRLYATEVAHRLILNYLLDPESLPDPGERIPYGDDIFFRHDLITEMLIEEDSEDDNVAVRKAVLESKATKNQRLGSGLKMVTVKIFHTRDSGFADLNKPLATVTRIYNPIDPTKDEDIFLRQVQELMGTNITLPSSNGPPARRQ
jgi:hypothetical protein